MPDNPLISVLTPAYNCVSFLPDCIRSVQAQTYPNWEMIIVDDGSPDGLMQVAQAFAKNDPRIRPFRVRHGGTPAAYNHAVSLAKGRVLVNQEADDWAEPTRLEKQLHAMVAAGADLVSCLMNRVIFRPGQPTRTVRGSDVGGTGCIPRQFCTLPSPLGPITGSIMAYKYVHEAVGQYITHVNGHKTFAADSDWVFRTLTFDPPFKWAHVPEELYNYRDHTEQTTKRLRHQLRRDHAYFQQKYSPLILERLAKEELCTTHS